MFLSELSSATLSVVDSIQEAEGYTKQCGTDLGWKKQAAESHLSIESVNIDMMCGKCFLYIRLFIEFSPEETSLSRKL